MFLKLQKPLRDDRRRRLVTCSQPRRLQTLFLHLHLLRSWFTDRAEPWMQSNSPLNSMSPQINNWLKGPSDKLLLLPTCRWTDPGSNSRTKGAVPHNILGWEVISLG